MADTHVVVVLRKVLTVVLGLLAACVTMTIVTTFIIIALRGNYMNFFVTWSWARLEVEHPGALIYDHAAQYAYLLSLDPTFPVRMPFPYPPLYLFLILPLGWLSYPVGQVIWSTTTFLAYMVAVCAPGWQLRIVLPALLAPAIAVNLVYGQNGFLTAALMVGGIRLAPSWPVAGGILLGLLAYKPQFGFLVVVALVAARLWRTAVVAAFTVAAAVVASLFAFGLESWRAWASAMPDFVAFVDSQRPRLLHFMPTALANMLALGASDRLAEAIQFAVTAVAIAAVWFAFKCEPPAYYSSTFSPRSGMEMVEGPRTGRPYWRRHQSWPHRTPSSTT